MNTLLQRAEPSCFDVGRRVHFVPDDVLARAGAVIKMTVLLECGPAAEYICIREGGAGAFMAVSDWQAQVPVEMREWLRDLTVQANLRCAGPGLWVFAWHDSRAPTAWTGLWFDRDGDFHFSMGENNLGFERQKKFGIDAYVANCALAQQQWAQTMRDMDFSSDQQVKLAQGEKPL